MMRAGLPARACSASRAIGPGPSRGGRTARRRAGGTCVFFEKPVRKLKSAEASCAEVGPRGEEPEVGVEPARWRSCSCRSEVDVAAHRRAFAAHDEGDLGVGLEARDAVGDVHARALERRAHWMLFSSSKRALSSTRAATCLPFSAARARARDDGRVAAGAVEGLLDREHVRVVGRGLAGTGRPARTSRTGGAGARRPCGSSSKTFAGDSKSAREPGEIRRVA